ncbi:hypothetical protein OG225_07030 [Nocardia sp. NBC_01377]|uniref:hypothetical protein n=1 Tax=Nocardia sp. NBC_01377 TaxID=2903595 RepID=UPI00324C2B14
MAHLVNCTPHPVLLHTTTGGPVLLPAADPPARVTDHPTTGYPPLPLPIPVHDRVLGDTVDNLPPPHPDVYYIVSRAVATTCGDRTDLLVPGPLHPLPPTNAPGATILIRYHHSTPYPHT